MGFPSSCQAQSATARRNASAVARRMPEIVGHEVPGQVAKAGRITDLHPAPADVAELKELSAERPPLGAKAPSGGSAVHEVTSVGVKSS